jgi:hypothetical protein
MGRAKEIIVKVIPSKVANEFVKKNHYSGKVVPNSTLHFGCFLDGKLHGVMSYGSPMVKAKVIHYVENTKWNEVIELNRMAFDNYLPKYSESRCIAISIKLIKKNAPQIKWILSFSDGNLCGDGTIYRATGFNLIKIKKNTSMWENVHTKQKMQDMQLYIAELEARATADIETAAARGSDELRAEIGRVASIAVDTVLPSVLDGATQQSLVENFISKVGASR